MANRTVREMLKILRKDGWVLDKKGGKGSHRKLRHPTKPKPVTVSGNNEGAEIPEGLWKQILEDAGLK